MSMEEVLSQIDGYVHDKKHFSARYLAKMSEMSGHPVDQIAKYIVGFVVIFLLVSRQAHMLANVILVLVPFLLKSKYREEAPNRDNLLVYWSSLGVLTLLDRFLDSFPLYYIVKILLLWLLFLHPFRFVNPVRKMLFSLSLTDESFVITNSEISTNTAETNK